MNINGIEYHVEVHHPEQQKVLVLLHGFTGSTHTWHSAIPYLLDYRIVLIDLLGHGRTMSPEHQARYRMAYQLQDLKELFRQLQLDEFVLAGYSMGGRTALAYACTYPAGIRRLILESASPGLRTESERHLRREQDQKLAERIERDGIIEFISFWENLPMFETQRNLPSAIRQAVREERLNQHPSGLAGSLYGMGTGAQAPYWDQLEQLACPVLLLTGTDDNKFTAIAREMKEQISRVTHIEMEAGHAIHVEKPEEFATIIRQQLKNDF
ncbi:2-succinyl-6-hydroxy-2,4-cyclohexadiene-1-carboxylate synthase [Planococcus lenghuensis]|uniref:Putative 2-succinyl-6-hydroxy-2,4-cyclohexadiene-1-carboxylate synthase n=1 Tax=Planococcus lenghuensis TaxID=2213202 RepID=A0A1Q2KYL2_9BACL|nr:2-succinyl-6-hydroxy-2,4-cyclohexadiene-1-carboxylate synthase [Planococcus lenghuensis]AQQ52742.1 2-succinyl-6-hydroxy-2,4-cyclohexadiene-1-carboxylate synthase [Planococcus lenghuensis]